MEKWKPGVVVLGLALELELEEQQAKRGGGREESKSQLERGFGVFFLAFFFLFLRTTGLCLQQSAHSISS
jgi:hypothetical protein